MNESKGQKPASAASKELLPSSKDFLSSMSLYRFQYNTQDLHFYINVQTNMYANWSLKGMKNVKRYFECFVKESVHQAPHKKPKKVFLQRNLKRGKESFNAKECFVKNRIAFKVAATCA